MTLTLISALLLVSLGALPSGAQERPVDPISFERNLGKAPASIRFVSHGGSVAAQFANSGMSLQASAGALRVEFAGAASASTVALEGGILRYRNTWAGIETQYAPHQRTLKSEYHVAPGSDPSQIRLHYRSETAPRILRDGSLMIGLPGAAFLESPPYAYQDGERRVSIPAAYRILADGTVGFTLGTYDPARPLVIDPVMNYSTLFGGSGDTTVTSVALDAYGNAVVAGWTTSTDLPAHGARTRSGGGVDAFVAKLSGTGNQVVWCTYLGGTGDDRAFGVAVDPSNNVYVTGWTQSSNFPVLGAIQAKLPGSRSAFVTKLNATGSAILYSTYLGGSNREQGNAIAVDTLGSAYVTGDSYSTNFATLNAFQPTTGGQQDAFVVKLNAAGNGLVFSTYLGGTAADHGASIALDASRNVYVTGSTYSANFPMAAAIQSRIGGGQDAFIAELSSTGKALLFSSFIGGSGGTPGLGESGNGVAVDVSGNIYVGGVTSSIDFPTTSGAFQRTVSNGGAGDHGFAWKLSPSRQLVYSTYIGGMTIDMVNGVAADAAGNMYLVGSTSSTDFPAVRAFQSALTSVTSAFLVKLNATGSGLVFGSFLGGTASDTANSVAVDAKNNIVIGGLAQSSDFPLVNPAQSYSMGPYSAFVTRVVNGWYPIAFLNGTWNCDIWRDSGSDGTSGTLLTRSFGQAGDQPVIGDWGNTGVQKLGVFRNGLWILDSNGNGYIDAADRQFTFGQAADIPLVGDWDGTGIAKAGLFRQGMFILDLSGHLSGVATGKQDLGFYFGLGTDIPITGDWGSTGVTKIGVFRNGGWYLDYNNTHAWDNGDQYFVYGVTGDRPLVGDWDGSGTAKFGVTRGGFWMLNVTGDRVFRSTIDMQFYYGNSSFSFLIGR